MKKTLRKKIILVSIIILAVLYIPNHHYKDTKIIEISYENDEIRCFNYQLGQVYIGSYGAIQSIKDQVEENDVLVIDFRELDDPDMQVVSSYKIHNIDIINEILEILKYYEESDPSLWDRTLSSMRNEWEVHNYSYMFNYDLERSKDVDLNNDDEEKYSSEILRKILRN